MCRKLFPPTALALVLCLLNVAQAQLKIDFTQTGDPVQAGFAGYFADHEVPATFTAQSYSAFGTTVTILPTWAPGAVAAAMQMIDRGGDDGGWYHATMVKSAETMTLYINGQPVGSAADNTQFDQPLATLAMGVLRHNSLSRYFPGALDEVRIYDRVLSDAEIAWLAGRTNPFDKP